MASSARKTNDLLDSVKGYLAGWRVEEDKYPADSGMPEFPVSARPGNVFLENYM